MKKVRGNRSGKPMKRKPKQREEKKPNRSPAKRVRFGEEQRRSGQRFPHGGAGICGSAVLCDEGERWFSAGGSVVTTLRYLYDENRSPVGFGLKNPGDAGWTNFYFAKNLQGDVVTVYRSDYDLSLIHIFLIVPYGKRRRGQIF